MCKSSRERKRGRKRNMRRSNGEMSEVRERVIERERKRGDTGRDRERRNSERWRERERRERI